jgi:hypothetical protein
MGICERSKMVPVLKCEVSNLVGDVYCIKGYLIKQ